MIDLKKGRHAECLATPFYRHIQLPLVGNNGRVKVIYLPAHTNHSLTIDKEAKSIPLTWSTQAEILAKLQKGISDNDDL